MNILIMILNEEYSKLQKIKLDLDKIVSEKIEKETINISNQVITDEFIVKSIKEINGEIITIQNHLNDKEKIIRKLSLILKNYIKKLISSIIISDVKGFRIDNKFLEFFILLKTRKLYELNRMFYFKAFSC